MTTVAELDEKISERKRQIAQFEARKKKLIQREREQSRKWRSMMLTTIGETLLRAIGCDWTQLDLESMHSWLESQSGTLHSFVLTEQTAPADAKKRLDDFKKPKGETELPTSGQEPALAESQPPHQEQNSNPWR